jgi:quercetin dioxygenase-like cupin family protein
MFVSKKLVPALALACSLASSAFAGDAAIVTDLMTRPMPESPGKELLMINVVYPPGAVDPVHRHDAHAMVYVVEGSIIMGVKGGKEVTLNPGDTFYEGPNDLHTVGRNASKTKPARFIVFLVKKENAPVLTVATE